jgi:hypothetical protein
MTGLKEETQAYFRASDFHRNTGKKLVRSWTTFFMDVAFYLEHRITREVESQGNFLLSNGSYDPKINIVNRKNIKPKFIKPGIERAEYEIDESAIKSDKILVIDRVSQLEALKRILSAQLDQSDERYKVFTRSIDEVIRALSQLYEKKASEQAKDLGY